MCKHLAAVLYGIGARLDAQPELFFTLRGVDMQELITVASASAAAPIADAADALAGADLAAIFGVEVETAPATVATKSRKKKPAVKKKQPSKKKPVRASSRPSAKPRSKTKPARRSR